MQGRSGPAFFSSIPNVFSAPGSRIAVICCLCCAVVLPSMKSISVNQFHQYHRQWVRFLVMFEDFAFFMTVGVKTSNENCTYADRCIAAGAGDCPKLQKGPAAAESLFDYYNRSSRSDIRTIRHMLEGWFSRVLQPAKHD